MSRPTHLEPSELGTKEYWDNLYANELTNHANDPDDTGTVWFDDADAEARVLEFLSSADCVADLLPNDTTFLDLGTGNGSLLFRLRDAGWAGRMLGVDYSRQSVAFARRLAAARLPPSSAATDISTATIGGEGHQQNNDHNNSDQEKEEKREKEAEVEFLEHDILRSAPSALLTGAQRRGWDVVLDKGTFDAVSLSSEADAAGRYGARVLPLVRPGALFVVTSCNWTEDELRSWFEGCSSGSSSSSVADGGASAGAGAGAGVGAGEGGDDDGDGGEWTFEWVGRVAYPSFSFGGVKGQTISTLCFRKVKARS